MSRSHRRSGVAGWPSPTMADAFNELRADYNAARSTRYTPRMPGVPSLGASADYHYRTEFSLMRMIELGRHFARNDMVVAPGIRRLTSSVLPDIFTLDPQTGSDQLDSELFERWENWTGDRDLCHAEGRFEFWELGRQCFRSFITDGDFFTILTDTGALQLVEAHRCRTPYSVRKKNAVHGIVCDEQRRPLEYWFTREDIDPSRGVSSIDQIKRYGARDAEGRRAVLHIYHPDRLSQMRGVSILMPAADAAGMHDDLEFAKLVQAQTVSCWSIFHEQTHNPFGESEGGEDAQHGEQTTETLADGSTRTIETIAPGMEYWGKPGEKLHGFSPNTPNAEFFPHATLILTFIAVNLDLPLQVLLLDPTKTNFSGWRGAIDQARTRYRELQRWWMTEWLRPVYEFCATRWIAEDPALARLAATAKRPLFHLWNPPGWSYIEPAKDVVTDLTRRRNGLISPRRQMSERGFDFYRITDESIADHVYAIRNAKVAAKALNDEFDDDQPVHWREVLSLPTPDGVTLAVGETPAEDEAPAGEPKEKTDAA